MSDMSLAEIFAIIQKRLPFFLFIVGVVLCIDLIFTLVTPPLYRASVKMIIQNETSLYPAGIVPTTPENNIFLNTQKEIITSSFIVTAALEEVKADGLLKDANYVKLKNRVSTKFVNDSNIMEISVDLHEPKEAAALANAIVASFLKYHANAKAELVNNSLTVINKELAALKANKDELGEKLNNLRDKEQLNFFQAQIPQYITNILELSKKNMSVETDIARLKDELAKTSIALKNGDTRFFYPLIPATGTASGENPTSSLASIPWMHDLKAKLTDAQSRLSSLSAEYTDNNPESMGLNNQITSLQDNLNTEVQKVLSTYVDYYQGYIQFLESQQKANETEKKRNETELNKIARNIDTASAKQIEYNMLLKNYDTIQDIYAIFLRKQNELQALKKQFSDVTLPNMRIFESAALPLNKVYPNLPLNMGLGLFIGMLLGISGILMEEKKSLPKAAANMPMNRFGGERRGMNRVKKTVVVVYDLPDKPRQTKLYASTENMSASGITLVLKERLPKDTRVSLEIHITNKDSIYANGRIVWISPGSVKDEFEAGVYFIKIEPQEREKLINYIYGEHYLTEKL